MIPIAICTVDRPEGYLHQTMANLLASDFGLRPDGRVHLCVGGPQTAYAMRYEEDQRVTVHRLTEAEWSVMAGERIHTRFTRNYLRCLRLYGPEGIIVLEDDVLLRSDWPRCLDLAREEMDFDGIENYVLALYYPHQARRSPRGKAYCSYLARSFFGTQAIYYPAVAAEMIVEFVEPRIHWKPGDLLLRQWCVENENLYATVRPLAQHVGFVSTGLGSIHQADGFDLPWPRAEISASGETAAPGQSISPQT